MYANIFCKAAENKVVCKWKSLESEKECERVSRQELFREHLTLK